MMLDELLKFFVVLLVVVEPLSLLPVLAGLTQGAEDSYRRHMAFKATGISAAVCLVFAVGGAWLLQLLGISVDAFKVGGGILLFLLAIEMVFARPSGVRSITPPEDAESHQRVDISVFPLAFPLISGPGALATILLAFAGVPFGSAQFVAQVVVIFGVLGITLALMLVTGPVMRLVGVTGGAVLGRLLGVLLAALAVQFVMDGIRGAMALP
jgi:multiple antibiotic resistance protein